MLLKQRGGAGVVLRVFYRWALEPFLVAIYLMMVGIMFVQIFCRYLLGFSISWSEELSLYMYVWIVYIAAVLGLSRGVHVCLDFFVELLPQKLRRVVSFLGEIAQLGLYVFVLVLGCQLVKIGFRQIGTSVPITRALIYAIIPASALLMCINTVSNLIAILRRGNHKWSHG
jgi:TRAP-type C4-dicarboxylate transport system permease small subunit